MRGYAICMTQDFCICITRTGDHELSPKSRVKFKEIKRELDRTVRDIVADGMADGTLAPGDPIIVTFTLTGALNWIARWYREDGPMSREQIVEGVVGTLTRGLAQR